MFVGQLLVLISLRYFQMNDTKDGPRQSKKPLDKTNQPAIEDELDENYLPFQEQNNLVSALMITISLLMFVGVDFLQHGMSGA